MKWLRHINTSLFGIWTLEAPLLLFSFPVNWFHIWNTGWNSWQRDGREAQHERKPPRRGRWFVCGDAEGGHQLFCSSGVEEILAAPATTWRVWKFSKDSVLFMHELKPSTLQQARAGSLKSLVSLEQEAGEFTGTQFFCQKKWLHWLTEALRFPQDGAGQHISVTWTKVQASRVAKQQFSL